MLSQTTDSIYRRQLYTFENSCLVLHLRSKFDKVLLKARLENAWNSPGETSHYMLQGK